MPLWKYVANRVLTLIENSLLGAKLSEYHSLSIYLHRPERETHTESRLHPERPA